MNSGFAFILGMIAGAVFMVFIIGLFIAEEDENDRRLGYLKTMNIAHGATEEMQHEDHYKTKEERERASTAERNIRLDDIDRRSEALFKAYYEKYIKQGYNNGK